MVTSILQPNIIAFFRDKVVEQKQLPSPYIVLEYAEYGSLEESWKVMDIKQVEALFTQLFEAVQYSHSIGLAHLDIKPANVLITSTYPFWVKLADFGFAQFGPWYESKGTFNYVAPEILRYTNVPYSNHADIWSLGMILLQMSMIGDIPSPAFWDKTRGFDNGRNQSSILWEDFFVQCSTARPKPGREHLIYIGRKMLVEDPHARPTAEGCTLLLNNHRKTIIRPWIRLDKRRSSPITICVSALLEYGGIEFTERQRILRQISKNAAYEVTYTSAATPNLVPGLYVDHLAAMEVAKDHLSSLVGVLKQLVDEENIEKAREG